MLERPLCVRARSHLSIFALLIAALGGIVHGPGSVAHRACTQSHPVRWHDMKVGPNLGGSGALMYRLASLCLAPAHELLLGCSSSLLSRLHVRAAFLDCSPSERSHSSNPRLEVAVDTDDHASRLRPLPCSLCPIVAFLSGLSQIFLPSFFFLLRVPCVARSRATEKPWLFLVVTRARTRILTRRCDQEESGAGGAAGALICLSALVLGTL